MANKIKCTCGHSWSTADSSAKDKYVCHICGKDNTMKDGGWLNKYEAPEAQNGIEGTMGGLTDKGFNYNGAWGGPSMAMGGSLPSLTGMLGPRIAGAAPANGKYTKKTLASAQNGKEMSFYQNGLDWEPRNISRDGSVIPQAQLGTHMLTPDYGKVGENMMEMLSAPQKALTALFSGKYQTPSEAMNVTNPVGAFAIDAVLDPVNLIGAGMAKNISKGKKAKDLVDLYRIQEKGAKTFAQLAKEGKIPKVFNNPETIARKTAEEKHFGQWFTNDKADLDWYSRDREFTNPEIINLRVPKSKLSQYQNYDKSLSRASEREFVIPHEEQKIYKKKKEGGVIKDDRGQWAHPGEITEIGSPYITMEGVPYPVLGVSDTGDRQMMHPGKDYKFKGKKVTEYPVSKNWLEKYK